MSVIELSCAMMCFFHFSFFLHLDLTVVIYFRVFMEANYSKLDVINGRAIRVATAAVLLLLQCILFLQRNARSNYYKIWLIWSKIICHFREQQSFASLPLNWPKLIYRRWVTTLICLCWLLRGRIWWCELTKQFRELLRRGKLSEHLLCARSQPQEQAGTTVW